MKGIVLSERSVRLEMCYVNVVTTLIFTVSKTKIIERVILPVIF